MESLRCRLRAIFLLATTDTIRGPFTRGSETPSYSDATTEYADTTSTSDSSDSTSDTSTSTGASSSIAPAACYLPFEEIGGRCLYVDPLETGSWYDMRLFCSRLGEGAHLVFLNDANILRDVIDYIKKLGLDHSHYWVGASDEDHEGLWQWYDGTIVHMGAPYWKYDCITDNSTPSAFPLRPQVDPVRNCAGLDSNYHFLMADFPCQGDGGLVPFSPICEGEMRASESF
ncbi:snaclec crotocetin-like isoform X2 [Palaemon carinicauda]|uniref:snaclec crotocetin-like isoform X2 n=1 Tax=Palaemon carinicauda TaxID=392227 RepID=UPI0035B5739C